MLEIKNKQSDKQLLVSSTVSYLPTEREKPKWTGFIFQGQVGNEFEQWGNCRIWPVIEMDTEQQTAKSHPKGVQES